MIIENIIKLIEEKAAKGIIPGLDNIAALCSELSNPQNNFKCIHIAGTNGKGSVCAFTESIIKAADIKVGCYTSPAVFKKTEQFRIMGKCVDKNEFCIVADEVLKVVDNINKNGIFPSVFEIETAIAFKLFSKNQCEICIIECGMGGKDDATNIIENTLVSAITPIALDHAAFLGNTLTDIAKNKCGIIKNNCAVVSAQQTDEVMQTIENICKTSQIIPLPVENNRIKILDICYDSMTFEFDEYQYKTKMLGLHQAQNAALAISICMALNSFGYDITQENIQTGIENTKHSGRFEIISRKPFVVIDGAHNPHGALALKRAIKSIGKNQKFTVIMGVLVDKDYSEMLSIISDFAEKLIAVTPESPRALSGSALSQTAQEHFKSVKACNIEEAAIYCFKNNEAYCVCGSLSYLKEFTKYFRKIKEKHNG